MKKTILAASAALLVFSAPVKAADLDRDIGLIVSGVVDQWVGVQFIDEQNADDDTVLATGGEGLLSLPLGDNLSIQSDVKYEYNDFAFNDDFSPLASQFSFQGAAHLSWRDPSTALFGVFGGAGTSHTNNFIGRQDFRFVGGEGQMYLNDITLYAQGGYLGFADNAVSLDEGFFARGVFRWFTGAGNRLQLEATYANVDYLQNQGDTEWISGKARYDFTLGGMPVFGDLPLFVAYRGTHRDNCFFGNDVTDHTVMVGTSYSFAGDRLTIDRQGATLDTPDFGNLGICSEND